MIPLLIAMLLPLGVCFAAWRLTGWFRRYAVARRILDIPNVRSLHSMPTPRGGGVAIALPVLGALPVLYVLGALIAGQTIGLLGGGALVALIGFIEDQSHIAPQWRLLGHFAAAAWVLTWLDGPPALTIFGFAMES